MTTNTQTHPGASSQVPRTEDYTFRRLGGTLTLGARVMPKTRVIRPTLGIAGGISAKGMFYSRNLGGLTSSGTTSIQGQVASELPNLPSDPAFYIVPSMMIDGGILLGNTPGTKFYLGCMMVADFGSTGQATMAAGGSQTQVVPPPTVMHGVNGTDIFVGPLIGVQFGD
jgi:hypothetical protein